MGHYTVVQRNPNSWLRTDKGDIHEVVDTCGHAHRSVATALQCLRHYPDTNAFGRYAQVENQDGVLVSDNDLYEAEKIIYEGSHRR